MVRAAPTALAARNLVHNLTQSGDLHGGWAFCLVPCLEAEGVIFNTGRLREDRPYPLYLDGHFP
jgi:hypothetical protein